MACISSALVGFKLGFRLCVYTARSLPELSFIFSEAQITLFSSLTKYVTCYKAINMSASSSSR